MKKLVKSLLFTGGVLCAVKGLDNRLEVSYYTIPSPKLPKGFDGFRIVQLSDYHCETLPGLVDEVKNLHPALIVCTGDMVNDEGSYLPAIDLTRRLKRLAPVYMITGNHDLWRNDYYDLEKALTEAGAVFLHNQRVLIHQGDDQIALTGIDDPLTRSSGEIERHLSESLEKVASWEGFDILLFHRANLMDRLKDCGFDLILSGHMHGGQLRLPGLGGFVSPKSGFGANTPVFFPKYFGGIYEHKSTRMIVSRGLGNPMVIPRLFNRPEIVMIELASSAPAKAHGKE